LQSREPNISENRLASAVGADRKTIRAWRTMEEFKKRVRNTRYLNGNPTEEDRKIMASWEEAIRRVNTRGTTS
jgi:hypothetical protein